MEMLTLLKDWTGFQTVPYSCFLTILIYGIYDTSLDTKDSKSWSKHLDIDKWLTKIVSIYQENCQTFCDTAFQP